jgi:hypothetical protein
VELVKPPCELIGDCRACPTETEWSAPDGATQLRRAPAANVWVTLVLIVLAFVFVLWDSLLAAAMVLRLPNNDYCRMYYSARAALHGEDMYGRNPSTPAQLNDDTVIDLWNLNPPHLHLLLLPLGALPRGAGVACWWAISLGCLVLSLRWIVAETGLELTPRVRQVGLVALLAFSGTNCMIGTGQLAFVLLLPLTLAWICARHGRWTRAGAALGMAISVKPFLLLLVPYLLVRRRWSAAASCGVALAACFAAGLLLFGIENHRSWLRCLESADSWAWLPMNASLLGMLSRTLSTTPYFCEAGAWGAEQIQCVFMTVGGVIAVASLIVVWRDRGAEEVDRSFALLLVASILVSPLGWAYYFWLPLGPVLAVVLAWRREGLDGAVGSRVGRCIFWAGLAGLFWPLQLFKLGQSSPWATVLVANVYFWTLLGLWFGLLLMYGTARDPRPGAA